MIKENSIPGRIKNTKKYVDGDSIHLKCQNLIVAFRIFVGHTGFN